MRLQWDGLFCGCVLWILTLLFFGAAGVYAEMEMQPFPPASAEETAPRSAADDSPFETPECEIPGFSTVACQGQYIRASAALVGVDYRLHYTGERSRLCEGGDCAWNPALYGVGSWTFAVHHFYDSESQQILKGSGQRRPIASDAENSMDPTLVASGDGQEVYRFREDGTHLQTLHALTGRVLYEFRYDSHGLLQSFTDAQGRQTVVERRSSGEPTAIVSPFGDRTELATDAEGRLQELISPAQASTRFAYDDQGLLIRKTNPLGAVWEYAYDGEGRLQSALDPRGGSLSLLHQETPDGFAVMLKTAEGRVSSYLVDLRHGTGTNAFPDGTRTVVRFSEQGSIEELQLSCGTQAMYAEQPDPVFGMVTPLAFVSIATEKGLEYYWREERSAELADPSDPFSLRRSAVTVSSNGSSFSEVFDVQTGVFRETSPEGRVRYVAIDSQGRVTDRETAGLSPVEYVYGADGFLERTITGSGDDLRVESFRYQGGLLVEWENAPGSVLQFDYDQDRRLAAVGEPGAPRAMYGYDAASNLTSVQPPGQPRHHLAYDALGMLTSYTPPPVEGVDSTVHFEYDKDRNPTRVRFPEDRSITWEYGRAGTLDTVATSHGPIYLSYDSEGRLSTMTSPGVRVSYAYDSTLVTGIHWDGAVAGRTIISYDNFFRDQSIQVNDGPVVEYSYDRDGLLVQAGELSLQRHGEHGLLTETALRSVTDKRTYNDFGEMASYSSEAGGQGLVEWSIVRDQGGRAAQITETLAGETTVIRYGYDSRGRLISVHEDGAITAEYSYDANGNRTALTEPDRELSAQFDGQDRLLQQGNVSYAYAFHDHVSGKTADGETTAYHYDELGYLHQVDLPDGRRVEYLVDGAGRRVGRRVDGEVTGGYLYSDPRNPVAELDENGDVKSFFVYASRSHVPDYMVHGDGVYRILYDHIGSVRLVVDADSGSVVQRLDYDAFGRVLLDTHPGFQPFGFAGGLYDPDTGLVRFGVRDYDPDSGRWTARDPILFMGGQDNLYSYVGNDPVNRIDPTGLQQQSGGETGSRQRPAWQQWFVDGFCRIAGGSGMCATATCMLVDEEMVRNHAEAIRAIRRVRETGYHRPWPEGLEF